MARRCELVCVLVLLACCSCAALRRSQAAALPEEAAFGQIVAYKLGDKPDALNKVASVVVQSHNDPELRKAVEQRLLAALGSPKATTDCKRFVCRQLVNAGTARSVAALAKLVPDPEMSHMALYALARLKCSQAGKALRRALRTTQGKPLVGVVNALGARRDARAVRDLIGLMKHQDPVVVDAAVAALGEIGGTRAVQAVADAVEANAVKNHTLVVGTYLRMADGLLAAGDKANAKAIYTQLYKPAEPAHVRAAALRGLLACEPEHAVALLTEPLLGQDAAMRRVAIGLVRDVPGAEAGQAFAAVLPRLAPDTQSLMLDALADRGDAAARPAAVAAAKSADEAVRIAAIQALAALGDASTVPLLVGLLLSEDKPEADAARNSLHRLRGAGVNQAILKGMAGAEPALRVALIKSLGARRADEAVPALLKSAADPDQDVQREAFNALRSLAGAKALASLVELLLGAKDGSARGAAERAIVVICGKEKGEDARLAPVLAALPKASGVGKAALLRIAGKFGGGKALAAVRAALSDPDPKVQDAAIRSLASWPDAAPAGDLLQLVKAGKSLTHKVLAMQGYVRALSLPGNRPATDVLKKFEEAMALAPRVEEKKLILSAMADIRHPAALKTLKSYLADKALAAEAKVAADKITKALNAPASVTASVNAKKAKNAIDGNKATRWDTSGAMRGGEWFIYELPVEHEIRGLELEQAKSPNDHPREYEVYSSRDGRNWGKPVAAGQGTRPVTKISFKPTYGRFIKILQTGKARGNFWSIHTMKVHSKLAGTP